MMKKTVKSTITNSRVAQADKSTKTLILYYADALVMNCNPDYIANNPPKLTDDGRAYNQIILVTSTVKMNTFKDVQIAFENTPHDPNVIFTACRVTDNKAVGVSQGYKYEWSLSQFLTFLDSIGVKPIKQDAVRYEILPEIEIETENTAE